MSGAEILLALELSQLAALAIRGYAEARRSMQDWRNFAEQLEREGRDATPEELKAWVEKSRVLVRRSGAAVTEMREAMGGEVTFPPYEEPEPVPEIAEEPELG